MTSQVEFFFDVGSPASYLAWTQLPKLCTDAGAELKLRPMLLGGVFQATGNASPVTVPAKGAYTFIDFARHAKRYGVTLIRNPHFPINTLTLMRAACACQLRAPGQFETYVKAIFEALWTRQRNLADPAVVAEVLTEAGLDAQAFTAWVAEDEVKAALKAATEEAVQRGVFGAPTCFVGGEMFFGQDRLDFVDEALSQAG